MQVNPIVNQQNFEGNVILKSKISAQQKHLFQKHKPNLDKMIEDMPFDLFVEQSKGKKTISLSTNVEGANVYTVNKNEQNFEQIAGFAIADAMQKSEAYKKLQKANEMLNYTKLSMVNIIYGNIKEAREAHKTLAKLAVEDFDTYKQTTNFKITNLPPEIGPSLFVNSIKYKIYYAFSKKTPEEKQLQKMNKAYVKAMKDKKIQIKPQEIRFPDLH